MDVVHPVPSAKASLVTKELVGVIPQGAEVIGVVELPSLHVLILRALLIERVEGILELRPVIGLGADEPVVLIRVCVGEDGLGRIRRSVEVHRNCQLAGNSSRSLDIVSALGQRRHGGHRDRAQREAGGRCEPPLALEIHPQVPSPSYASTPAWARRSRRPIPELSRY